MNNEQVYLTKNSEETKNLAIEFAKEVTYGDFLALYGELGSGKTTFIQGLAEDLGIKRRIISPTFIIIRSYKIKNKTQNLKLLYHIDLYRIAGEQDIEGLGIDEIIKDKNNIIALEWAEKMGKFLPRKRIELYFKYIDENTREIKIKKYE